MVPHTAQRDVRFGLTLWGTHVFRERVAQLRHRILVLGPVMANVHLLLVLLLRLALTRLRRDRARRSGRPEHLRRLAFSHGRRPSPLPFRRERQRSS